MTEELISYYDSISKELDWNPGDWADDSIMKELFHDFLHVYNVNGKSILDAGCGVGNFYRYMMEKGYTPREVGCIDLVPSLIEQLQRLSPEMVARGWHVGAVNFFEYVPPKKYDVVVMFGLSPCLNHQFDDKMIGLKRLVELGLSACNDALYINFLNAQYEDIEEQDHEFYVTFHPAEVAEGLYNLPYTLYNHGFSFFSVLIQKDRFFDPSLTIDRQKILHYT